MDVCPCSPGYSSTHLLLSRDRSLVPSRTLALQPRFHYSKTEIPAAKLLSGEALKLTLCLHIFSAACMVLG